MDSIVPKVDSAVDAGPHDQSGKQFWRTLEELSNDEQFLVPLRREFPEHANRLNDGATRRQFLQLMGASLALAGVQGCMEQPQEQIVSFVEAPEKLIPGQPLYYATAMTHDGAAVGLLVESHMGRPVKIDGNPLHPAVPEIMANAPAAGRVRLGASDAFAQAIVLSLYDPDRSQAVAHNGQIDTWESFLTELQHQLQPLRERGGQGLRVLTGTVVSPTLGHQLKMLLEQFPQRAMAPVRAAESRQRACRQSSGAGRGCRDARPCGASGCDFVAGCRFSCRRPRSFATRAGSPPAGDCRNPMPMTAQR